MSGESTCARPTERRATGRAHGGAPAHRRASSILFFAVVATVGCDGDPSVELVSSTSSAATASPRAADVRDAATTDAASGPELDSPPTEERPFREGAPDLQALVATYDVRPEVVAAARARGHEERLHERLAYRWTRDEERARRVDGFRAALAAANVRDQRAIAEADRASDVRERARRRSAGLTEALRALEAEVVASGELQAGSLELPTHVRERASALVRRYSTLHPDDEAAMATWLRGEVQALAPTEGDRQASEALRESLERLESDPVWGREVSR